MTVLVVGGNGQLGAACCAELLALEQPVRVTVRDPARAVHLDQRVEVVALDVTEGRDRRRVALDGVETVVLTANAVAPRRGDRADAFDRAFTDLVDEAAAAGVRRLVLPSIPVTPVDRKVPFARARRELEERVAASEADGWVLQFPPFMEAWLALVGSTIPLRGEPYATIGRPSPFLRRFRGLTGSLVEGRGRMLVPGPADHRHAFISVRDAARACAVAATGTESPGQPVAVAGPEVLSWVQVAQVFGRVLGRDVRVSTTPAAVFAVAAAALGPVAAVPARTMALNRYLAAGESAWPTAGGGLVDAASMTTVEQFLRAKADLPGTVPAVP